MASHFLYDLPENGYIVFKGDQCVGMGFLRLVEGFYGMMDGYITDPTALPNLRNQALEEITNALIERAKELKLKKVLAFAIDPNILKRAHEHGFMDSEFKPICLHISKDESLCHF